MTTAIADRYVKELKALPRVSPREAESHPLYKETRLFLKTIKGAEDSAIARCRKEFAAFQLGLSSEALDQNEDFEKFSRDAHLSRYLIHFDHRLQEKEGQIYFVNGASWEEMRVIAEQKPVLGFSPNIQSPAFRYDRTGIVNRNYYLWDELKPYKTESSPSWGRRYLFEVCCLCQGTLRFFGDHSWIRLKTPEGDVYSAGLYREDNDWSTAFSVKEGRLQSPDVSEFWPEEIHVAAFEITKEHFLNIKEKIESDQRNGIDFQVLDRNCTSYACELARLANIRLEPKGSFLSYFIPSKIYLPLKKLGEWLPPVARSFAKGVWRMVRYPFELIGNLLVCFLGGLKKREQTGGRYFSSFLDFFNPRKMVLYSPYLIAFKTIQDLKNKREGRDPFEIPQEYLITPDRSKAR